MNKKLNKEVVQRIFNSAYSNFWIKGIVFENGGVTIKCLKETSKNQIVNYIKTFPDIKIKFVCDISTYSSSMAH